MERIKVLIADDHRVVREGLVAIMRESEDLEVVGEARDGQEAVEKARELSPDVILMDVSMPRMNGVEATRAIKRESPHIGVVALTMYDEEKYIFDLVRAGATGYLLKDSESSQIISAIRSIYKGESLIHPSVASKILAEFSLLSEGKGKKPARTEHDLTEREITVLRLVAAARRRAPAGLVLFPRQGSIRIPTNFPKARLVFFRKGDGLQPLGAFPGIALRHDDAHWTAVFLGQRQPFPCVHH